MAAQDQDPMGQFFDFGSLLMPETTPSQGSFPNTPQLQLFDQEILPEFPSVQSAFSNSCSVHPFEACLCDQIIADFGLDQPDCNTSLEPENYANFKAWIPRYSKPERSCEYCRSKHLECFFTYEGQHQCSPCNALFRACSFSTHESRPNVVMDTLHTVAEDQSVEQGALTGIKALNSFDRTGLSYVEDEAERASRKTGTRFPRAAVKILKDWMDAHATNPYPTEEEKEDLMSLTGLKDTQITNWMANTRRRRKQRSRGVSPSMRSPALPEGSKAMDIPFDKKSIRHNGKTWDIMNPLERWQHSPPENEPALVEDIAVAVAKTSRHTSQSSLSSSNGGRPLMLSSNGSSSSLHRHQKAPSVTSLETGQSDSLASFLSSGSLGSSLSQGSRNSFGSNRAKDRRRRRRTAANPSKSKKVQELRPFQCTFCTDRFRTKYDWARHEKSLHLSLEKWLCAPLGPEVSGPDGRPQCVYCGESNPSREHTESHNHKTCYDKGMDSRTFYRKDHLRQHLRLVHGCKMTDSMDTWKSEASFIKSRCGFCKQNFTTWQDRIDHLAKHFRAGSQMKDWKGCRGLDPAVAAQVTNAMPPYLIGTESLSPNPFSASNEATWGQFRATVGPGNDPEYAYGLKGSPNWEELIGPEAIQEGFNNDFAAMIPPMQPSMTSSGSGPVYEAMDYSFGHQTPNSKSPSQPVTCWEILTVALGKYVQDQLALGLLPTDEELQIQGRRIIYEDEDSWNQTAADNPEWLELFKKAYGMPSTATDLRVDFDEDLGARVGDLSFDGLMFDSQYNAWEPHPTNNVAMTMDGVINKFATSMPPVTTTCPEMIAMNDGSYLM